MVTKDEQLTAEAIVFAAPGTVEIRNVLMREPGPNRLLTRTTRTGISTGTETRVLAGKEPDVRFPLIPGYENVGVVEAGGDGTTIAPGTRVVVAEVAHEIPGLENAWGAQVSHVLCDQSRVLPIPDHLTDDQAVYTKVAGIAAHGVKRGRVTPDDVVVVVGLGLIGNLVVQHAVACGAQVVAVDLDGERLQQSRIAGAEQTVDAGTADIVEAVLSRTGGGATIGFDVTGRADTIPVTARMLRPRPWDAPIERCPRLVIQGSPTDPICFRYNADLFDRELDVITSRDTDLEDLAVSLERMSTGALRPEIIPHEIFPISDASQVYHGLTSGAIRRALFRWSAGGSGTGTVTEAR